MDTVMPGHIPNETTFDTLRRAAALLRAEQGPSAFHEAVANWLEFEAETAKVAGENKQTRHALDVANAYL